MASKKPLGSYFGDLRPLVEHYHIQPPGTSALALSAVFSPGVAPRRVHRLDIRQGGRKRAAHPVTPHRERVPGPVILYPRASRPMYLQCLKSTSTWAVSLKNSTRGGEGLLYVFSLFLVSRHTRPLGLQKAMFDPFLQTSVSSSSLYRDMVGTFPPSSKKYSSIPRIHRRHRQKTPATYVFSNSYSNYWLIFGIL